MKAVCLLALAVVSASACKSTAPPAHNAQGGPQANVVAQASPPPASVPTVPLPPRPAAAQAAEPPSAASSAAQGAAPPQSAQSIIDPQAMQALDRMSTYLRSLNAFEVESVTSTDEVVEPGLKVQLDGSARMQVRRPDRLHLTVNSDRKQREVYFDGKTFTLVAPRLKYYAVTQAPPTLAGLFDELQSYDIEMPLADLFLWGTERSPKDSVRVALSMGPATIDGTVTDQYLFGQDDISWQVWIQRGDKPLPRKLVVTTLTEPQQPQHMALMRWNTAVRLDDGRFIFAPARDAIRIPLHAPQAAR